MKEKSHDPFARFNETVGSLKKKTRAQSRVTTKGSTGETNTELLDDSLFLFAKEKSNLIWGGILVGEFPPLLVDFRIFDAELRLIGESIERILG